MIIIATLRRAIYRLGIVALLASLTACLDEIPIEPQERPDDGFVIQGQIVKGDPTDISIKVERLFQFTSNINQPVLNASVRLQKDGGETLDIPPQDLDGSYHLSVSQSEFPVQAGDRFRIEVQTADTDDIIVSDWEVMEETMPISDLSWDFTTVERISQLGDVTEVAGVEFFVSAPTVDSRGNSAHLRWQFIDAYRVEDDLQQLCYFENQYRASSVTVLDGATAGGTSISNYALFKTSISIRHIDGYYLTVMQQNLNEASFAYWSEVASLQEREGTIFDNPAGTIRTNLSNTTDSTRVVYGYFSAIAQDTNRLFISREDMGNLPYYCPRPVVQRNGPPPLTVCDDCLIHGPTGASLTKPDYWE